MLTCLFSATALSVGLLLTGCSSQATRFAPVSGDRMAATELSSTGSAEATFVCLPPSEGESGHGWQYRGSSVFLTDAQGHRLGFVQMLPLGTAGGQPLAAGQPDHRLLDVASKGAPVASGFTHARRQAVEGLVPPRVACGSHNVGGVEIRPYRAQFLLVRIA